MARPRWRPPSACPPSCCSSASSSSADAPPRPTSRRVGRSRCGPLRLDRPHQHPRHSSDAKAAARASLANQEIHCLSVDVSVDTSDFSKPVGEAGTVAVTVECRLDLSDLSVPGVPGSRVIKATMSSPLDTWRERG